MNERDLAKRLTRIESRISALESMLAMPQTTSATPEAQAKPRRGGAVLIGSIFAFFIGVGLLQQGWEYLAMGIMLICGSIIGGIIGIVLLATEPSRPAEISTETTETPELPKTTKATAATSKAAAKQPKPSKGHEQLESEIGTRWTGWAGIIVLVLGIVYFVTYAITNAWIGPIGQITLGCLAGIGLILVGEYLNRKPHMENYALTLEGGGFGLLYFSVYAAHKFYAAQTGISAYTDMVLLAAVSVFAALFAIKTKSRTLAAEAFALAYLTPFLLVQVDTFTASYAILLTATAYIVAYSQEWDFLAILAGALGYITQLAHVSTAPSSTITEGLMLLTYLIIASGYAHKAYQRPKNKPSQGSAVLGWCVTAATIVLALMNSGKPGSIYFIPFIGAGIFLTRVTFQAQYMEYASFGAVYLLQWHWLTAQLDQGLGATVFWAHVIPTTIYFLISMAQPFYDQRQRTQAERLSFDILNAAAYFGLVYWRVDADFTFAAGSFTLALAALYLVIAYIHTARKEPESASSRLAIGIAFLSIAIPIQLERQWITIAWFAETLALGYIGVRRNDTTLKLFGHGVAAAAIIRLLAYDTSLTHFTLADPLASSRLIVFALAICALYVLSTLHHSQKEEDKRYASAYWISATLLTCFIIYLEINASSLSQMQQSLGTTLGWALQASIIIALGFWKDIRGIRLTGLAIFTVCVLKAFLSDLSFLETPYRIVSFIILGLLLLGVSYVYTKQQALVKRML